MWFLLFHRFSGVTNPRAFAEGCLLFWFRNACAMREIYLRIFPWFRNNFSNFRFTIKTMWILSPRKFSISLHFNFSVIKSDLFTLLIFIIVYQCVFYAFVYIYSKIFFLNIFYASLHPIIYVKYSSWRSHSLSFHYSTKLKYYIILSKLSKFKISKIHNKQL